MDVNEDRYIIAEMLRDATKMDLSQTAPVFQGMTCTTQYDGTYLLPTPMVIGKKLNWNTRVYRFISIPHFIEMIETASMYFNKITAWDDPWEMPYRYLKVSGDDGISNRDIDNVEKMYGVCWTREFDTEAMWNIYGKDRNSICFSTTIGALFNALKFKGLLDGTSNLFMGTVKYEKFEANKINDIISRGKNGEYPEYMYPAFLKRDAFSHEHEVRLLLFSLCIGISWRNVRYCSTGMFLPLNNLTFVDEVILNPHLSEYEEIAQKNCLENKRYKRIIGNFAIRKSDLYSPQELAEKLNCAIRPVNKITQVLPEGAQVFPVGEIETKWQ